MPKTDKNSLIFPIFSGPEVLQGHPAVDCSPAQLPAEPNRSIIVWWSQTTQTPGNMQIQRGK